MAAHNVYNKYESRELVTTLNRISVFVRYNEIKRSRKKFGSLNIFIEDEE